MPTNQAFNTSGGTATVEAPVEAPAPSVVPAVPSPPATTSRRAIPEMTADGRPILDVWISYRDERCEETRNVLVEHYLKLVRYTAERLHSRLPSEVDVEDLMSSGLFGLIDAINAFDLERGVKFSTYCTQRIRVQCRWSR
jgi:DNA-directed RNA polymerase sigma subunit (sigma70/sigma32)